MKRCHDCGNEHNNKIGWCDPCHTKPSIPNNQEKQKVICNHCHFNHTGVNVFKNGMWVCPSCFEVKNDGYGGFFACTFCYDDGIPGGCARCGLGIIEAEDS